CSRLDRLDRLGRLDRLSGSLAELVQILRAQSVGEAGLARLMTLITIAGLRQRDLAECRRLGNRRVAIRAQVIARRWRRPRLLLRANINIVIDVVPELLDLPKQLDASRPGLAADQRLPALAIVLVRKLVDRARRAQLR